MSNPNYSKKGGTWYNTTNCYVKNNGSWTEADEGWKNINGTWTKFYDKAAILCTIQFYATASSVTEGDSGTQTLYVRVDRGELSGGTATVDYATSNGTATAGVDYVAASGTLTFTPAGNSGQNITITINNDTTVEANETFNITLSNPTQTVGVASITGTNPHVVTITNDDSAPGGTTTTTTPGGTTTTTTSTTTSTTTTTTSTTTTTAEPTTTTTTTTSSSTTTTPGF